MYHFYMVPIQGKLELIMKDKNMKITEEKLLSIKNVLVPHMTESKLTNAWKLVSVNTVCPP